MATIRIDMDEQTFRDLLVATFDNRDVPEFNRLYRILTNKLDKMITRDLYTRAHTAPTEDERERARAAYLDKKGIPDSYRW